MRILVLEDDDVSRQMIHRMLRVIGIDTVYEAIDGQSGFATYMEHKPNLLMCDMQMTPVNGLDFLTMVRDHEYKNGLASTPVICISADSDSQTVERAKGLNITGYLIKPLQIQTIRKKIEVVIRSGMVAPTDSH